jgi:carbamoyl-phosphate synthase large subunit
MKSTGEVMGIARNFPAAYIKTQLAIDYTLPNTGKVFISVNDRDKRSLAPIARDIVRMGFDIVATAGTARSLAASGIECEEIGKLYEGTSDIVTRVANGEIDLIINTPLGSATRDDAFELRAAAVRHGITYVTTLAAAQALLAGMEVATRSGHDIVALQDLPQYEL